MNFKKSLDGDWALRLIGKAPCGLNFPERPLKGTVPGTIHTDLISEGVIPDPFYRDNESQVQWIESLEWEYSKEFDLSKTEFSCPMIFLAFEGIDTAADVFLNGSRILECRNMFRSYRIRIDKLVRKGSNILKVVIHSPKAYAKEMERKHGRVFAELDTYRVHIRKAQYSFGWDWGPRLATSGIWRSVYIDFVDEAYVYRPRLHTLELNGRNAEAVLNGTVVTPSARKLAGKKLFLSVRNETRSYEFSITPDEIGKKKIRLAGVNLWWTHDFGSPDLYNATIGVASDGEEPAAVENFKTGFRAIKLIRRPDRDGESFIFELNRKKIFAKGANWIPSDSFLPRVDAGTYARLVKAARDANMNMIRVWGGGVYENEKFYDACDENGILVWQDFMFACASYPDYASFTREVELEARENLERLSAHPCLALFCGNNEGEWIWRTKTGKTVDKMPGAAIFKTLLRDIVHDVCPRIPYWRSSPFGGDDPDSQAQGNHHQWEVWSRFVSPREYLGNTARFVTEFGFQSPPSLSAIRKFTEPGDRDMQSNIMRSHNKQVEGTERLFRFLSGEVKMGKTFDIVVYQMQLVQAKAIRTGVEHWRSRKWRTAGTIFWQLNDCWPVSSWSAIDYYMHPKALYYWSKDFFKPVKIIFTEMPESIRLTLVNDTLARIDGTLFVSVCDLTGEVIEEFQKSIHAGRNSLTGAMAVPLSVVKRESMFIRARLVDPAGKNLADEETRMFGPWLDFKFDKPTVEVETALEEGRSVTKLKSDRFIEGVCLPIGEQVGQLSDNFFTLIPGEEKIVTSVGVNLPEPVVPIFPLLGE